MPDPAVVRVGAPGAIAILNGVLVTMPDTIDDQVSPDAAASRAIVRIAGHVVMVEPSADGIRQQLARQRADEVFLVADDECPQTREPVEPRAIGKARRRIDRRAVAGRPPLADGVEVLERKAERIHPLVARRARRILARCTSIRSRSDRGCPVGARLFERGNVGWRRRRRRAEQIGQEPAAAHRHRRAIGIRRDGQHARVAEQTAARAVGEGRRDGNDLP